ncbi:MAG: hypothetical protein Q4E24_12075 [bacterium]|nr:hypothetical protein [bacterium]
MHNTRRTEEDRQKALGAMLPGQDLVVAGKIAQSGVSEAAQYFQEELRERFSDSFLEKAVQVVSIPPKADEIWKKAGAEAILEAGEGGIFACLWELSGLFQKGFTVELQQIPVRQDTIELCEVMGLNPYRLESRECIVFTAQNGYDAVRFLQARGIQAAWIGKVEKEIRCRIMNDGIEGFLERPREDELSKAKVHKKCGAVQIS